MSCAKLQPVRPVCQRCSLPAACAGAALLPRRPAGRRLRPPPALPHPPPRRRLPVRLLPQAPTLPPGCDAGGKPHMEELFEHRWRKAYEVRALERESRHAKSQVGGGGAGVHHAILWTMEARAKRACCFAQCLCTLALTTPAGHKLSPHAGQQPMWQRGQLAQRLTRQGAPACLRGRYCRCRCCRCTGSCVPGKRQRQWPAASH